MTFIIFGLLDTTQSHQLQRRPKLATVMFLGVPTLSLVRCIDQQRRALERRYQWFCQAFCLKSEEKLDIDVEISVKKKPCKGEQEKDGSRMTFNE